MAALIRHVVQQGECLGSLAERYGVSWRRIWSLAENQPLRARERTPNLLFPGDILYVPERDPREEPRPTDQRHRFVLPGRPIRLRLRILAAGKPVKNEKYRLEVDGTVKQGKTDGDGKLDEPIPGQAAAGVLFLGKDDLRLDLEIGCLDPVREVTGAQARLHNIGYYCGAIDGRIGPISKSALLAFQETNRLSQSGEPDAATRERLVAKHGC
jgi:N-acetylmuramoyl-L-alanine amidase